MSVRARIAPFADTVLPWLAFAAMVTALACVFLYVPNERMQGPVQRIFYFHVNSAWSAFMGFGVAAAASALFLWRGDPTYDRLARAAVEVGMLFCTMVLVTGPIWARPIWGTWWTWDPRLTMTVILWTVYAVYLVLRSMGQDDPQIARYAAVLAIVGVLDVPLIMISVRLWRGMHPSVISAPAGTGGIQDPRMIVTLVVALVAFALLFLWLLWRRAEALRLEDELHALADDADAVDGRAAVRRTAP
ncbi:MAG: cytochrome c biogenesis protein CcsA [Deltaproteobacteria bacterium]|nr:cytochrome c biogenesis protein CcsA [Deltaproteobacteria bacterium]